MKVREAVVRYVGRGHDPKKISGPDDIIGWWQKDMGSLPHEEFRVVHLGGRHQILSWHRASQGTATASLVHPREVFRPALMVGACAVILVHNHPSGDAGPSREDIEVTLRVAKAGHLLGIPVLDHLVLTGADHSRIPIAVVE